MAGYVNSRARQYGTKNTRKSPRKKYEAIIDPEVSRAEKIRCRQQIFLNILEYFDML
jgi:hypothetical protein